MQSEITPTVFRVHIPNYMPPNYGVYFKYGKSEIILLIPFYNKFRISQLLRTRYSKSEELYRESAEYQERGFSCSK